MLCVNIVELNFVAYSNKTNMNYFFYYCFYKVPNRSYVSMAQPSPDDLISHSSQKDHDLILNDTVSYELPPNNYDDVDGFAESIDIDNSTTAGSNLGLSTIVPPSSHNQSTPKKQSFTTKVEFFIDSY